jgi:hypothetical protein
MRSRWPTSKLARVGSEYGRLELELLALEDLRRAGRLTVRGYYKCRNERLARLGELMHAVVHPD